MSKRPAIEPTDEQLRSWGYDGPNGRAQYKRDEAAQGAAPLDPRWCHDKECFLLEKGVWGHPVSAHEKWEGVAPRAEGLPSDEQIERWLTANDLYVVTHLHESQDCVECVGLARPSDERFPEETR